ncbi:hypothetical protein [Nocardioides jiangxiensis]|uniref:FlgD Ig-like domain-containing protein n=1 Tax=Nocardioides jiangxiensis TaxID=3064524 RepID=A0ABT9B3A4_9ACTN|nr:hypothetical protein [Nocardioides sp. WY-20]MDO7868860.1 hypothetical protein [Nocardioides sp. WY-20]
MRRHLLAAALIAGSVTVLAGTPAYAAPAAPTLTDLDTSVAGHVTGTVTGGADAQSAWVCWGHCHVNTGQTGDWWIPLDPSTHAATFDLPTWGFSEGEVGAVVCSTAPPKGASCDSYSTQTLSDTLTATDVIPTVTWPTDATIGHNPDGSDQQASVTMDDAGGGSLRVVWSYQNENGDNALVTVPVAHTGSTQLALADGVGTLTAYRCSEFNGYDCVYYHDLSSPQMTVARSSQPYYLSAPAITSTVGTSHATLPTSHHGTFQATWHVSADGTEVSGSAGSASGPLADDGSAPIDVPGSGLPDGDLTVEGTIAIDDPDFGPSTTAFSGSLLVDRQGPAIEGLTVTRTGIHPTAIDALASYRTTTIKVHDDTQLDYADKIVIDNASGAQVRVLEPEVDSWLDEHAVWDGRDEAGDVVPDGTYTVSAVDPLGNRSDLHRTVAVAHTSGVLKTFSRTVTAGGSKVDGFVGRCSNLKSPASRGWSGSRGYYANTRCRSTRGDDSVVLTVNGIQLPQAVRYGSFRVDTYGGASRGYGGSQAALSYHRASDGDVVSTRTLGSTLGTHTGTSVSTTPLLLANRVVLWSLGTANFNHYDVKSFTVTARYYAWS